MLIRRTLALLLVVVAALVSSCGFVGDPGPPIALVGTASHSLEAVAILKCSTERVLDVAVSRDVGKSVVTPGETLWHVRATAQSAASLFYVDSLPPGFAVVTAAQGPLTGDLAITVRTTKYSWQVGITTKRLPPGAVYYQGHQKRLDQLPGLGKSRC
jgi:hypothetical protein